MEEQIYKTTMDISYKHWWYLARNKIIESIVLKNILKKNDLKILDAGCGTGSNISMLKKYGKTFGLEPCDFVVKFAQEKHPECLIKQGYLPDNNPYNTEKFDLITSLDVLEHIEKDVEALKCLKNMLTKNGLLVLTVPAFQSMYSYSDAAAKHFRRYSKKELQKKLNDAGFSNFKIYYFNTFLFLPIYIIRMLLKIFKIKAVDELKMPSTLINKLLYMLFQLEKHTLDFNIVGISLCAVAKND